MSTTCGSWNGGPVISHGGSSQYLIEGGSNCSSYGPNWSQGARGCVASYNSFPPVNKAACCAQNSVMLSNECDPSWCFGNSGCPAPSCPASPYIAACTENWTCSNTPPPNCDYSEWNSLQNPTVSDNDPTLQQFAGVFSSLLADQIVQPVLQRALVTIQGDKQCCQSAMNRLDLCGKSDGNSAGISIRIRCIQNLGCNLHIGSPVQFQVIQPTGTANPLNSQIVYFNAPLQFSGTLRLDVGAYNNESIDFFMCWYMQFRMTVRCLTPNGPTAITSLEILQFYILNNSLSYRSSAFEAFMATFGQLGPNILSEITTALLAQFNKFRVSINTSVQTVLSITPIPLSSGCQTLISDVQTSPDGKTYTHLVNMLPSFIAEVPLETQQIYANKTIQCFEEPLGPDDIKQQYCEQIGLYGTSTQDDGVPPPIGTPINSPQTQIWGNTGPGETPWSQSQVFLNCQPFASSITPLPSNFVTYDVGSAIFRTGCGGDSQQPCPQFVCQPVNFDGDPFDSSSVSLISDNNYFANGVPYNFHYYQQQAPEQICFASCCFDGQYGTKTNPFAASPSSTTIQDGVQNCMLYTLEDPNAVGFDYIGSVFDSSANGTCNVFDSATGFANTLPDASTSHWTKPSAGCP